MTVVALELWNRAVIAAPTPMPLKRFDVALIRKFLRRARGLLKPVSGKPHAVEYQRNEPNMLRMDKVVITVRKYGDRPTTRQLFISLLSNIMFKSITTVC